jgi:hypothetical protein
MVTRKKEEREKERESASSDKRAGQQQVDRRIVK